MSASQLLPWAATGHSWPFASVWTGAVLSRPPQLAASTLAAHQHVISRKLLVNHRESNDGVTRA